MMHCEYFDAARKGNHPAILTPIVTNRIIGSRPRAFQRTIAGVRTLPLGLQRVAQKPIFFVFWIKVNFNRIKSATKFRCVKNSSGSGKVVEQSISYEITEKYRTKSVSFHLKYWLKLAYPVVASTCMLQRCHDSTAERRHVYNRVRTTSEWTFRT